MGLLTHPGPQAEEEAAEGLGGLARQGIDLF